MENDDVGSVTMCGSEELSSKEDGYLPSTDAEVRSDYWVAVATDIQKGYSGDGRDAVCFPPQWRDDVIDRSLSIFLAGSDLRFPDLPVGDWRTQMEEHLSGFGVVLLDPWWPDGAIYDDTLWEKWLSGLTEAEMEYRVRRWRQRALDEADLVIFDFGSMYRSAIDLLELGSCAFGTRRDKVIVCCPKEVDRHVRIFCKEHGIPVVTSLEQLVLKLKLRIRQLRVSGSKR